MLHFNTTIIFKVESDHRVLKSTLKIFIEDFMIVVDDVKTILKRQYETHIHELTQIKMKIFMKLSREFMRNLIDHVSFYALSKIYDQYLLMRLIMKKPKKHKLKSCERIFATTMNLSCAHMIATALKIEEKKLLLENVHSH